MRLSLGTRGMRFSNVAMGFQPSSLALSASMIREDKEGSFCPVTARSLARNGILGNGCGGSHFNTDKGEVGGSSPPGPPMNKGSKPD